MPTSFSERVYRKLQEIPAGRITTYKLLGKTIGTKAYQAIGQALKHNPNAPQVPCHRVIKSDGTLGGYMGKTTGEALQKKIRLLSQEGIHIKNNKIENFETQIYKF
jgi:methylated-DNA-[protein]-cysteine S-methyltransferase